MSAPSNYQGWEDCKAVWDTLDADKPGGATLGTIDHLARLSQYRGPRDCTEAEKYAHHINAMTGGVLNLRALCTGSDVEIARVALRELLDRCEGNFVFTEGEFYSFDSRRWAKVSDNELRRHVHQFDGIRFGKDSTVKLGKARIDSIIHEMGAMVAREGFFDEASIGINCANGFLDFSSGAPVLVPHGPTYYQRHIIEVEWHNELNWRRGKLLCRLFDGCFKDDPDKDAKEKLLGEVCGAALLGCGSKLLQPKSVVLYGPKANNGKSETLGVLAALLPPEAVCAIPPSKFGDDRHAIGLVGKNLNAAAELGTANAIASDAFKGIITGDMISARQVYKPAVYFRPRAQHVFACNNLPGFTGGFDQGVRRRLLLINFNRVIPKEEQIKNIASRIGVEERQSLLAFAVEGACRLLAQGAFTEPPSSGDALREWMFAADPVIAWKTERTEYADGNKLVTRMAYSDFQNWARQEGLDEKRLPAINNFVARILAHDGQIAKGRNHTIGRFLLNLRLCVAYSNIVGGANA